MHQVHDDSTKLKFNVPHAHHLRYQGISLLPFTIDHLGGLGYQATNFLFGSQSQIPAASQPPEWTTSTFRTNPEAYTLYKDSLDTIPSGILLPSATHNWQLRSPRPPRFGRTYHTYTPTQWATQALALNLTKTLSQHIITHRNRILTHTEHQRRIHKQTSTLQAPYYLPPPPFLLPSDTTLETTSQIFTESHLLKLPVENNQNPHILIKGLTSRAESRVKCQLLSSSPTAHMHTSLDTSTSMSHEEIHFLTIPRRRGGKANKP
jgi:hypothetical protein